jgi:hypothetical protein
MHKLKSEYGPTIEQIEGTREGSKLGGCAEGSRCRMVKEGFR